MKLLADRGMGVSVSPAYLRCATMATHQHTQALTGHKGIAGCAIVREWAVEKKHVRQN